MKRKTAVLLLLLLCMGLMGCYSGTTPEETTMAEQYPEAYALFTEMYGEYFALDEEGMFTLSVNENGILTLPGTEGAEQRPLLPSELEFVEYQGTDLTVEIDRIEDDMLYYSYTNHMSTDILLYNGHTYMPYSTTEYNNYVEVMADGLWWTVDVNYSAKSGAVYNSVSPGENQLRQYLCVWVYEPDMAGSFTEFESIPFPAGTYRMVQWLQPLTNAAMVTEFEIKK